MTPEPFVERFAATRAVHGPLAFGLDPSGKILADWGLGDEPGGLERFVDLTLEAAVGVVGIVKPQSAFFERHGWRGLRTLARLVSEARSAGLLVLLDAKRGDVGSTNEAYAEAYLGDGAGMAVDAMTVTPYLGLGAMGEFIDRAVDHACGLFVVTRSSNPEGRVIQEAVGFDGLSVEGRLVADIARLNAAIAPGGLGPVGAVFGPTHGPPRGLDLNSMGGLFLAPGVGEQGATPQDVAACFSSCPERVLPSASRYLLAAGPEVAALKVAISELNAQLQQALLP
jgi:orotidine-5'-phosphate decarboxylase